MSWFSGIGHALNKVVQPIDKLAPKLDPLNKFNSTATADTLGKIPVIGKGIDNAQGKIANHPVESAATLAALYYGGGYLLGGGGLGAGAADAGAAEGAGAGLAADGGSINLFADAVPGAAGDVGASALGDAAVGGASDAAAGGLDSSAVNLFSDAVPGAGGDVGASALGDAAPGFGSAADLAPSSVPSTSSGFGGVGTDPSVASSPDGGLAFYQQAGATPTADSAAGMGSKLQDALKLAMKYGPAGVSLLRGVMGKDAYARAAAGYGNVGATQRATANGLVQGYNNGTLNPAESAGIDRWAQQQVAALRQFYANAGTADSTQAKMAEAAVMQKATEMKNQATQDLLKVGLNELNTLDQNTVRGIQTNLQGDVAAQQAQAAFAAQFAKLIGSTGQTATPATTTGP